MRKTGLKSLKRLKGSKGPGALRQDSCLTNHNSDYLRFGS